MSGVKVRQRRDGKEPRWQVDFYALAPGAAAPERRRYTAPRNVTSKSGAVRWAEHARREIEAGRPVPQSREGRGTRARAEPAPASEALTLGAAVVVYLADLAGRGARESAVKSQRERLDLVLETRRGDAPLALLPLADAGEPEASLVRSRLRADGYAVGTINNTIAVLGAFLRRCCALKLRGPVERLALVRDKAPRRPKAYDDATFEAILARTTDPQRRAVILLGGEAGLRPGEVCGLNVGDVDLARGVLHVRRSVDLAGRPGPPKGGDEGTVPLTDRLAQALTPLVDGRPTAEPLLVGGAPGGRVSRGYLRGALRPAQRALGIPVKGPHVLRHRCATSALRAGADPVAVKKMLRHKLLRTTLGYVDDTEEAAAARARDALQIARDRAGQVVTDPSRVPGTNPRRRADGPKSKAKSQA